MFTAQNFHCPGVSHVTRAGGGMGAKFCIFQCLRSQNAWFSEHFFSFVVVYPVSEKCKYGVFMYPVSNMVSLCTLFRKNVNMVSLCTLFRIWCRYVPCFGKKWTWCRYVMKNAIWSHYAPFLGKILAYRNWQNQCGMPHNSFHHLRCIYIVGLMYEFVVRVEAGGSCHCQFNSIDLQFGQKKLDDGWILINAVPACLAVDSIACAVGIVVGFLSVPPGVSFSTLAIRHAAFVAIMSSMRIVCV